MHGLQCAGVSLLMLTALLMLAVSVYIWSVKVDPWRYTSLSVPCEKPVFEAVLFDLQLDGVLRGDQ